MNRIITLFCWMALPIFAFAQPINDDCDGLIDLGVAPFCPDTVFFTNVDATATDIGFGNIPACFNGGVVQNDVWFAFTSSDTIFDYTITVTGLTDGMGSDAMENPQVVLYRGDCSTDNLAELACASAELGETVVELDVVGLTPNIPYFIRVTDYSASATPNWGTFQLCVDETEPASTIDEGGSTACSGILFDSGGEEGDYGPNEDHTFTICPSQPNSCILFTLDYYFIENQSFDVLSFYDGDSPTTGTLIDQIGGFDFAGGGVCYQVQATSGCMTVTFQSDGFNNFEGFAGSWECSGECPEVDVITLEEGNVTESQIIDFVATASTQAMISNISCPDTAYALFQATDNSGLGLERGLLMTSGAADIAIGPNDLAGEGFNNFTMGDPDLDFLSEQSGDGTTSQDACIIELDVLAATNELTFEYVFGSEEYPEFVNSGFNDIFAFLISGPGIVGDPGLDNQLNIAVLPNGNPVQINSVNNLQNWEYYRDNDDGLSVQYDGLTSDFQGIKKSLTAKAEVQACSTYHIKFAIADRGDGIFDSGVFISELRGGAPELSIRFNSGIDYLLEGCTPGIEDEVLIEFDEPVEDSTFYDVVISGTAELGIDYIFDIPSTILFPPGTSVLSFPIAPLDDLIPEEVETITISLVRDFGCGATVVAEVSFDLAEELLLEINAGQDTLLVCEGNSVELEATGAASYFWTPVSIFNSPTGPNPIATPTENVSVVVEGSVGACVAYDTTFLELITPEIELTALDPVAICQGDSVQLSVTDNVDGMNLTWTPTTGLDDPTSSTPIATPQETTEYIASVEVSGCVVSDAITIDVLSFDFPELAEDTLICQNFSVQLADAANVGTSSITIYSWSPDVNLDDPNIPDPIATPQNTTTYTLIASSNEGACADTASVLVEVFPANVSIINPDSIELCIGDTLTLSASTSTGSDENLVWSDDNGQLAADTLGLSVSTVPTVSGWYFATFSVGACTVTDSSFVRIDSLPDLELTAIPEKESYCQGDSILLVSPTYTPSAYPDIEHIWTSGLGFETPDSLFNMVVTAQSTIRYERITIIGGCRDTADILIDVVEPPLTTIMPADTAICLGESVQFLLEIDGEYDEVSWSGPGLSCDDCLDPVATPTAPGSANYNIEITADGCESPVGTSFEVLPDPIVELNTVSSICQGGSLQLNFDFDPLATYIWTASDPNFETSTDPLLVVAPSQNTTYSLVADNGVCPPLETSLSVAVIPDATVSLSADPLEICEGESVMLMANVTNGGNDATYTWVSSLGDDLAGDPEITDNPSDDVTYTLTFVNASGCDTLTESISVAVQPAPTAAVIDSDIICLGDSIQLNSVFDETTTYVWTSDDPSFTDINNPQPTVSPAQTSTYTLTAFNGLCDDLIQEVTIEVIAQPSVEIVGPVGLICSGDDVPLVAVVTGGSSGDMFDWVGSNGTSYSGDSIIVAPNSDTEFTLTYASGGGCVVLTDSYTVNVEAGVSLLGISVDPNMNEDTFFIGDQVVLSALYNSPISEGLIFSWFENDTLIASGDGLDQITVELLQEGESVVYSVAVETPTGCTGDTANSVAVIRPDVQAPNVFTPNEDDTNDVFDIVGQVERTQFNVVSFQVFNRWGQMIYEGADNDDETAAWDGTFNGKPQPVDVYFYQITVQYANGVEAAELNGNVTILR